MHSTDWSRLLTERQREVLSIVVENKVYRNRDSKISELAAQMGIAPAAVAKHLLEIEKEALLQVVVTPRNKASVSTNGWSSSRGRRNDRRPRSWTRRRSRSCTSCKTIPMRA